MFVKKFFVRKTVYLFCLATLLFSPPLFAEDTASLEAAVISTNDHQGPKTAKHLTIGIWNTAGNITTYTIGNSWNDWLLWLAFDKLREPSPYVGQSENWLATDIKQVSDDARSWEITLREGVKWHDGTELTADDVVFTMLYYREGPANRWTHHTSAVPRMETVEKLDRYRLRITAEKPMPNFDTITAADLPIIQKNQWENVEDPRKFEDLAIGTGPYKLVEYEPDQYYRYEANKDYWKGAPTVDEITLVMIKDPQTMFTALKTGEIDGAARSLPPELVLQWQNDPAIEIAKAPTLWGTWLDMNLSRKPFDNREFRRALALSLDADAIAEKIMLGQAKSGSHGWPHVDSFWTKPSLSSPYDITQATSIFDTQGFVDADNDGWRDLPDGSALDLSIKVPSNQPLLMRGAEMTVEQLAAVNIKAKVETMDPASFNSLWSTLNYDLRLMDITPHGIADQDMLIILYRGDIRKALATESEKDAIVLRWHEQSTRDSRLKVSYELQDYQNKYPNRVMMWYPDGYFAYRWDKYDNYVSSSGYGIFHKYSFLSDEARAGIVDELVHDPKIVDEVEADKATSPAQ